MQELLTHLRVYESVRIRPEQYLNTVNDRLEYIERSGWYIRPPEYSVNIPGHIRDRGALATSFMLKVIQV